MGIVELLVVLIGSSRVGWPVVVVLECVEFLAFLYGAGPLSRFPCNTWLPAVSILRHPSLTATHRNPCIMC